MERVLSRIAEELRRLQEKNDGYLGYPLAKDFNYELFAPFLNLQINNVGDPFMPSSLAIDTKAVEREVVLFFSHLLRAKTDQCWGYVTNGGSEGNLYGLYLAREAFPKGMVYYSESTHYSVRKNLHLLGISNIVIRSQENGEIDYQDLENSLLMRRDQPAIFFLNIGTTMHEAIDSLEKVKQIIRKLAIKDYYIHCDAALLGSIAPFLDPRPKFDFMDGVDSVSISGHKFIGSPIPCGVVLTKKEHKERVGRSISYVGTKDTTITGSRNGLSPLFLWYAIKTLGLKGLKTRVQDALELAGYLKAELQSIGIKAWSNPNAITIVFDKPSQRICDRYQLAVEEDIAHVICVPGISKDQIDEFIDSIRNDSNGSSESGLSENQSFFEEFFVKELLIGSN